MKEKQYNPAQVNETAPAPGMAAVNTFNSDELEQDAQGIGEDGPASPKNLEREEQHGPEDNNRKD